MGTDNYTKEEREFYESIMQEIRSHQDFGKRNPVDIGIECGYSEDDVMGMIYMCQDIVGEKQTQQEPIPTRENWDLEGIIPFEDFVKIDFPTLTELENYRLDSLWCDTVCEISGIEWFDIKRALEVGNTLKSKSLEDIYGYLTSCGINTFIDTTIKGFEQLVKWMSVYGIVASNIFENKEICIPLFRDEIAAIKNIINEEIKAGEFHPIDELVIEANGWNKKLEIQ